MLVLLVYSTCMEARRESWKLGIGAVDRPIVRSSVEVAARKLCGVSRAGHGSMQAMCWQIHVKIANVHYCA